MRANLKGKKYKVGEVPPTLKRYIDKGDNSETKRSVNRVPRQNTATVVKVRSGEAKINHGSGQSFNEHV